jgi:hypothetical protein
MKLKMPLLVWFTHQLIQFLRHFKELLMLPRRMKVKKKKRKKRKKMQHLKPPLFSKQALKKVSFYKLMDLQSMLTQKA